MCGCIEQHIGKPNRSPLISHWISSRTCSKYYNVHQNITVLGLPEPAKTTVKPTGEQVESSAPFDFLYIPAAPLLPHSEYKNRYPTIDATHQNMLFYNCPSSRSMSLFIYASNCISPLDSIIIAQIVNSLNSMGHRPLPARQYIEIFWQSQLEFDQM